MLLNTSPTMRKTFAASEAHVARPRAEWWRSRRSRRLFQLAGKRAGSLLTFNSPAFPSRVSYIAARYCDSESVRATLAAVCKARTVTAINVEARRRVCFISALLGDMEILNFRSTLRNFRLMLPPPATRVSAPRAIDSVALKRRARSPLGRLPARKRVSREK